ncbi:DUF378 domain-containing protein [Oceanobacillus halophilus]|uniref:DUF378 domain-containing protein n=1 Tax=Oceanobacillus halophilus TaxID=930130 RepID=A0A494ZTU3_9BACI|nr:DUF378 domain-containing protein [Oceanobacillus halophilus]RKQ29650.1 DUF378 domain-containing protein [Oceanobacillus halophilus]
MRFLNSLTLTLIIIGALNWGLIAFFQFDLVAAIFGGQNEFLSRVVYGLVGLSGLYYLTRLLYPIGEDPVNRPTRTSGQVNYGTEFAEELDVDDPTPHSLQTYEEFRRPTGREED